ncbi:MAG: AraC family transcriptional regulator [Lachnospiraceae bacterium]|nr:AraC family transcriptional regulator [Lachnospiraceae bacterium]
MEWIQSINRAIDYIEDNILEDIHLEDVAEQVHISLFHFQRTFNLLVGMTAGEYIRKRRLSLAGEELTKEGAKVIDIAFKYGYESPESFSKAFTRFHGITPKQAGKGMQMKNFNKLTIRVSIEGGSMVDYRIEKKDSFSVIVYPAVFTEENSAEKIPAFWNAYFQEGLNEKVSGSVGICFQESIKAKEFLYGIGSIQSASAQSPDRMERIPADFRQIVIPAHTWAVFQCVGVMPDAIQNMWKFIYGEWLPAAAYELIPNYDIEYYPPGDKDAADYVSEIWIPVREKS